MHSRPESFQTSQLLLAKGQSHFEQLPRGTVIHVAAGSMTLVQHSRLDHCLLTQKTGLQRGAVHCVEVPTWVEIVAQSDANLRFSVPQVVTLWAVLRAGLNALLERLAAWPKEVRPRDRCKN